MDKHQLALDVVSTRLTGQAMLTEAEIVAGSLPLPEVCGIYFLIDEGRVVYVGQSLNVLGRMPRHAMSKQFDRFAYIPCDQEALNFAESLYIHALQPPLNGPAPISMDAILAGVTKCRPHALPLSQEALAAAISKIGRRRP